jgi:hypothetical protein
MAEQFYCEKMVELSHLHGKTETEEMKRGGVRRAAQRHVAAKPGGPVEKKYSRNGRMVRVPYSYRENWEFLL